MKNAGLTLVELMVVVAVLAILSAIAYPLYTDLTEQARRADAKIALKHIAMTQERFYSVNGRYSDDFSELYTGTLAVAAGLDWPCSSATTCGTERGYYNLVIAHVSDDQDFLADANNAGAQASDGECANFDINEHGVKTATDGGGENCW
jgi:type IV pilus assembly protein PilE